jgi:hypothetical protein
MAGERSDDGKFVLLQLGILSEYDLGQENNSAFNVAQEL